MSRDVNSHAFTPEEVEKGLHLKLLKTLLELSNESTEHYNDIHITSDGYCTIIEWVNVPYSHEWGGQFNFVDEDQVIMTEKMFPDNHTELCYDEEDYKEKLDEFLKEYPGWVKTPYGAWTNEIENERFRKMLEEGAKKDGD